MKVLDLTPKQAQGYLYLTHKKFNHIKELGYGGGAGGGKSILGCAWIIQMCEDYPGVAYAIGRKELSTLKKTTLLSFFQVAKMCGLRTGIDFKFNSQTNIINFSNGSTIFLVDMAYEPSDPLFTKFGGLELTGAFVDESNENAEKSIEILKTRIGRRLNKEYGIVPKLLETFNPDKGHVYRVYYKPWKDKTLPKSKAFIPALVTDNPHLDENYIEQLKNAEKVTRERLLYGNFDYDDDPAKLFEYDRILDIFTAEYNYEPRYEMYISCDVARFGTDKTVIVVWKGWHIEKIIDMDKSSGPEVVETIKKASIFFKVPRSNIVIDDDGVGGMGVVDWLPNCKGFINNSSPIETQFSKKIHNFANLKTQCYFKLADKVNTGSVGCYDLPNEIKDRIIEDLEQIAQKDIDKGGRIQLVGKDKMKLMLGRSPDYSDAIMMRCLFDLVGNYRPHIA